MDQRTMVIMVDIKWKEEQEDNIFEARGRLGAMPTAGRLWGGEEMI